MKAPLDDGGARIRSYQIIALASSSTDRKTLATMKTSSPIKAQQSAKVSGLTPGTTYRFVLTATNALGASTPSESSATFLAPNLPGAPSITTAVASSYHSALITYNPAPSDGGSPITEYTITASPGGMQSNFLATDAKSHTFTGLSTLTTYTFTIHATNIAGSGLASARSNQITTFAPPPQPEPVAPTPSPSPSSSAAALAAPAFTLSSSSETGTVNTAATGFTISSTGGAIASFAISATPAGMSFSTSTGALSGTPTTVAGATNYTVTATNASGSATQAFTLTVAAAESAAAITTQPTGAASGSQLATQPVIRIVDASGNTVTSSTVSVVASIASGTGTLSGTTTVTASSGIATFTDLVITGTAGNFTLTFTPASLSAVTSNSLAITAGAASAAAITTQPIGAASGSTLATQPVIRIVDASGNTVTSPNVNVVASIASGSGTLSGTTTVASVAGVATFTNLVITGTAGAFTLRFTPTSLTPVTSSSLTITAGAASAAAITTQPTGAASGSTFDTYHVIRIVDVSGNTVTSSTVSVVASIASGTGTLSGTTTVAASSGIATFTNLLITTAGDFTLRFTPTGLTAVTSSTLTITYAIGDTGPGGGIIFYYLAGGFNCGAGFTSTGSPTGGACHYLEVAQETWSGGSADPTKVWAVTAKAGSNVAGIADDSPVAYNNPLAIGLGYKNSDLIVTQNGSVYNASTNNYAAGAARAYTGGSKSDWYLPTTAELNLLCQWARNVTQVVTTACTGGTLNSGTGASSVAFVAYLYWSSSELNGDYAWYQSFDNGVQGYPQKISEFTVRPVRSF